MFPNPWFAHFIADQQIPWLGCALPFSVLYVLPGVAEPFCIEVADHTFLRTVRLLKFGRLISAFVFVSYQG